MKTTCYQVTLHYFRKMIIVSMLLQFQNGAAYLLLFDAFNPGVVPLEKVRVRGQWLVVKTLHL
jgi:hypothetical protein